MEDDNLRFMYLFGWQEVIYVFILWIVFANLFRKYERKCVFWGKLSMLFIKQYEI